MAFYANYLQQQCFHQNLLNCDFKVAVLLKGKGLKLNRCIKSIDSTDSMVKYLGYTENKP